MPLFLGIVAPGSMVALIWPDLRALKRQLRVFHAYKLRFVAQRFKQHFVGTRHPTLSAKAIDADVGYTQLIEDFLIEQSKSNNYDYELLTDNGINWQKIPGDIKMNIYRIMQETVQNINKYAKANNVKVALKAEDDFIHLTISDDGIGFNLNTKKDGIGIKNIRSRIERLNGNVEFISELKKGTSVVIKIPNGNI
mgnify:CR=1 FL=1